jgi:hypothetical protein
MRYNEINKQNNEINVYRISGASCRFSQDRLKEQWTPEQINNYTSARFELVARGFMSPVQVFFKSGAALQF